LQAKCKLLKNKNAQSEQAAERARTDGQKRRWLGYTVYHKPAAGSGQCSAVGESSGQVGWLDDYLFRMTAKRV